ncbi:MAG: FMN-binding protein [Treponema sp.]|nr:FMN-binding protein [Treponema sp.]
MKNDFVMPILILSLICLIVTGALAIGHNYTQPIIAAASAGRTAVAMRVIVPHADSFEPLKTNGLPSEVNAVYRISNNEGYIFIVTSIGFGGDVVMMSGIDSEGRLIRSEVLSHSETPSFSAPVFSEAYASQHWGQDRIGAESIAAVSGSTFSSAAFKNALQYTFDAFEIVRERQ